MDNEYLLTTIDNPYNPFEDFSLWELFDKERGHNTCDLIARLSQITDDMTQREEEAEYDRVAEFILRYDPHDKYKKFYKNDTKAVNNK